MKVEPKLEEHTMQQHMFHGQPNDGGWHWPSPIVDEDPEHAISCVISIDLNGGVLGEHGAGPDNRQGISDEARSKKKPGRKKKKEKEERASKKGRMS